MWYNAPRRLGLDDGIDLRDDEDDEGPVSRSGRKERTRARLLAAAEDVFGLRGFNDASIVEITRRAGVALGTFYVYFPSKTEVFSHILETRIGDLRNRIREARDSAQGPELERGVLRAFLTWASEHPNAYRAARYAEYVEGTPLRDWYSTFVEEYATRLRGAMDEGIVPRTDPEVLAWAVAGMADLVATRWIAWNGDDPGPIPPEHIDTVLEIAMRALGIPTQVAS
jgi:AcrR family transcriptional regulator